MLELLVPRDVGLEVTNRPIRLRVPSHKGVLVDVPDVLVAVPRVEVLL